ncbi:hypothetical protein OIU78_017182 [Salix suchowensis]|nr:hypothetical protein OIU78_017182 [Salix suchowensis]
MDEDNSLDIRNWGYYEPTTVKGNLGLHLMAPTMPENSFSGSRSAAIMTSMYGGFHHRDVGVSQHMYSMDHTRDSSIDKREKFHHVLPGNHDYASVLPETSSAHHMQMFQPPNSVYDETLEQVEGAGVVAKENGPVKKKKKRPKALKCLEAKKGKIGPQSPKPDGSPAAQQGRSAKKTVEIMINGISMDISLFPIPVCSCTGNPPNNAIVGVVVGGNQLVVQHVFLCIPCL